MSGIIYLAAPYWHADPWVRQRRFDSVTIAAAQLVQQGKLVFSPLTHSHPIDLVLRDRKVEIPNEYWVSYDEAFMEFCSEMVVLKLGGWRESKGVARETAFFMERGRPVTYLGGEE
jgi:hypothetical protein